MDVVWCMLVTMSTHQKRVDSSTDQELLERILDDNGYPGDGIRNLEEDLYTYMKRFPENDWTAISIEATRLFSLAFPDLYKDEFLFYFVESLISAVTAQSAEAVWNVVANWLGIDKEVLYDCCASAYENGEEGKRYWQERELKGL